MKGYKIGIDPDTLEFVLIELEVPEEYPGVIVYEYITNRMDAIPLYSDNHCIINIDSYARFCIYELREYRSNVAKVLDIRKIKDGIVEHIESAVSLYDPTFHYRPGEMIYPDVFNPDRTCMCTGGIHFFKTVEEAIKYTEDPWARCRRTHAYLARNNARYIVGVIGG